MVIDFVLARSMGTPSYYSFCDTLRSLSFLKLVSQASFFFFNLKNRKEHLFKGDLTFLTISADIQCMPIPKDHVLLIMCMLNSSCLSQSFPYVEHGNSFWLIE